jgi:aminoglycoside phosphotransferase (APT) family kinase protein
VKPSSIPTEACNLFEQRLTGYIHETLSYEGKKQYVSHPPQGMSSSVIFVHLNGNEYAVKYGKDATKDVPAIVLIKERLPHFPVPVILTHFVFEEIPVVVLQKVEFPLLDSVSKDDIPHYIPSMVSVMKELHTIKSEKPYVVSGNKDLVSWKDYMLAQFDGTTIDWSEVLQRNTLDHDLVASSLQQCVAAINKQVVPLPEYALLHTDFNQRNLFVDPKNRVISGVIDWEDAVFGDPLYDFARIRMFIWHFGLSEDAIHAYYNALELTSVEMKRERLYWVSRVVQYLAWYSEEETDFNLSRIALHENFLRTYEW